MTSIKTNINKRRRVGSILIFSTQGLFNKEYDFFKACNKARLKKIKNLKKKQKYFMKKGIYIDIFDQIESLAR
jgi:hypothetical protein